MIKQLLDEFEHDIIKQSKTLFYFELVDIKIANISEENKSIR